MDTVEALGQLLPDSVAKLRIVAFLQSPDALVRAVAAEELGRVAEDTDVVEALLGVLRVEQDDTAKACLVETLGDSRSERAVDDVGKCIGDEEAVVRMHACTALGRLRGVEDCSLIIQTMSEDESSVVRIAASIAAARQGVDLGVSSLIEALNCPLAVDEIDIALNLLENALSHPPRVRLPVAEFLKLLVQYRKDYHVAQVERIEKALNECSGPPIPTRQNRP